MLADPIAQLIRSARLELALSQEKLAEILGVSTLTVSKYETGRRSPRMAIMARFAELCGYPISWFCDEQFRNLALPTMIWSTDDQFQVRWVCGKLTQLLPPRTQVIGKPVSQWFGINAPIVDAHQRAAESGEFSGTIGFGSEAAFVCIQRLGSGYQGIAVRAASTGVDLSCSRSNCAEQLADLQRQIYELSRRLPTN